MTHVGGLCLIALSIVAVLSSPAWAGCQKSLTLREIPGGEPVQAQLVECDESERPALLEGNAHLTLCSAEALAATGASFQDCATAVDAARTALLEGNAHLTLCSPEALAATGAAFEDCATAVDAARTALRKAKIRAAVRNGTDTEVIESRYGASTQEVEALRASAERSGSVPEATVEQPQ